MEENNVELIDYLRVIWKRKILIIAVILVCIGVGVGVVAVDTKEKPKLPVTYCAEAVLKIGKKVKLVPSSGISSHVITYIENPGNLVESIPLEYGSKVREGPEYYFDVEQLGSLPMISLTMKGLDRGVERVLKEIVDLLINEHRRKAQAAVIAYEGFMKRLEMDAEKLNEEIAVLDASIKEMKKRAGEYLIHIESITKEEETKGDRSAYLNMLYLKTIDKEGNLSACRAGLRNVQMQLIMHRITLGNLEEYKTELVGEMQNTVVEPKEEEEGGGNTIAVAGFAGLIMSLFIVFFLEYIDESKSKRKGK